MRIRSSLMISSLTTILVLMTTGSSLCTGQPDLSFQGGIEVFGSEEESYRPGEVLTISVKVVNVGDANAENVDVQMFVDGMVDKVQTLRTVKNESDDIKTVIFTWVATKGTHRVAVQLDPDNTITESSEKNNLLAITITVLDESIDHVVTESSSNVVLSFFVLAAIGGLVLFIGAAVVVGVILMVYFVKKN